MTATAVDLRAAPVYRDTRIDRMVYAGMAVSLAASPFLSPHTVSSGPVLCPFRRITGLPCPGCGMTRSFVALAHGDVSGSFAFNRLGPVMMAVFVIALVWKAASLVSTRVEAPEVALVRVSRRVRAGIARSPAP